MPAWLTWKLFWKIAPYLGAALALGAAVWFIDHRGYERAAEEAAARENERKQQLAEFNRIIGEKAKGIEDSMQTSINNSDAKLVTAINRMDTVNKTIIQPTLVKEIQNDPRFSDPASGITDGMLWELNRARGLSQRVACPAGSNAVACFTLSDPEPARGQDAGDPGN